MLGLGDVRKNLVEQCIEIDRAGYCHGRGLFKEVYLRPTLIMGGKADMARTVGP